MHSITAPFDARPEGSAVIFIAIGGTCSDIVRNSQAASADVILYGDVTSAVSDQSAADGVVTLRLASGETLGHLLDEYGSPDLVKSLRELPAIDLHRGCGQYRPIGNLIGQHGQRSGAFRDVFFREIYEPLQIKHRGCLLHVTIYISTSIAGGTGSGIAILIACIVSQLIREFSNAVVVVHFRQVGSLTFTQLGDRVHANAAATLAEDVDFMLSPERDHREVRCLELVEMPMVGPHKDQRDSFVMAYQQGISAPAVREWLDLTSPNEALSSHFGNIRIVQASYGRPLGDRQVAADVAGAFLADVEQVLDVPPLAGVGEEFKVIVQEEPALNVAPVQDIGELVKSAKGIRGAEFWAQCTQVPFLYESQGVLTNDRDQDRVPLRKRIINEPRTLAEWADKIGTLKALVRGIRRELEEREEPLRLAREESAQAKKRLENLFHRFFPKNWWGALRASLSDPVTSLVKLQNAVTEFRERASAACRLECEYAALVNASAAVGDEFSVEVKRLQQTADLLRAVGSRSSVKQLVMPSSVDLVLPALVQEAVKQAVEIPERVYRLIASCVGKVTLAGLAAIVACPERRPGSIAYHVTHERPVTRGPAWGGRRRLGPTQRILVLPPMPGDAFDDLKQLIAQHSPELMVAMAETACSVVNVVYLEIFSPRNADDIFTPFHRQYLRKAMEEPHLYFTRPIDASRWLEGGTQLNGRKTEACES